MPSFRSSSAALVSEARLLPKAADDPVIRVRGLRTRLGDRTIHEDLDLDIGRGEIVGVVGASGSGKSVLLRTIIGLHRKTAGRIEIFGRDLDAIGDEARRSIEARWGVLFQSGALFSSLSVLENVEVPLKEHQRLPPGTIRDIARLKLAMVGLPPDAACKYPAELSGGMVKRAGLARALVLDPELLFLDEPTAGLDPIAAGEFDALIRNLRSSLNLTVFMVTHDLDSLHAICDRIAVLIDKKVKTGKMAELLRDPHPWLQAYFHGPRGRAALAGTVP
jgi:phospholipid/cholesterol/gamma-HCH transport system ATP-binding protein